MQLDKARVIKIIKAAIKEDLCLGDITTKAVVDSTKTARARIFAREEAVVCGIEIAEWIFAEIDYSVRFKPQLTDGQTVSPMQDVAFMEGRARSILMAERLTLNFLSLLSGISTETKKYADKAGAHGAKILDTRKTLPLLRYLQKYAVVTGGGHNHRMNLAEMVMVKDNHLKLDGGNTSVAGIRRKITRDKKIEVETDNLDDFRKAIAEKPDVIMLDNMSTSDVRRAVDIRNSDRRYKGIVLEASGGITLENVADYAATGVDTISIGAITDSVRAIDYSLDIIS